MEEPAQALAYSEADFAASHQQVVAMLLERCPSADADLHRVVDLGCGPADVTVRLAEALPHAILVGLDAGPRMLDLGRERIIRSALDARVQLQQLHLPAPPERLIALGAFDLVASNSLLHHLADPGDLWVAAAVLGRPGAVVHVVDLRRPADDAEVDGLVERYAAGEPAVLVEDFRRSLRAAYRPAEVKAQLAAAGLAEMLTVETVSDRHLLVHGRLR